MGRNEFDRNILSAKYLAEKWSEPIYDAVINSNPLIAAMDEQDVRLIIGVCYGLNIMYKELCDCEVDSDLFASSVAESSIIMAHLSNYTSDIGTKDKEIVANIIRAREGQYGEIPGTQIKVEVIPIEIPCRKKSISIPKRKGKRTKYVRRGVESKTYLMLDNNTGYVKIGKAINPRVRERTLQSEKPTITLFKICKDNIESVLHMKYSSKRVRGEWFNLTKDDIEWICKEYNFKEVE